MDKTRQADIVPFSVHVCSFLWYAWGVSVTNFSYYYWWYACLCSKPWHTKSICDNLFDLKRSSKLPQKRWHHSRNNTKKLVVTTTLITLSHFHFEVRHWNKPAIFHCFHVFSVRPSLKFQVQVKISTISPVFSGYLSVSYDYDFRHLHYIRVKGQSCINFIIILRPFFLFWNWSKPGINRIGHQRCSIKETVLKIS